MKIKLIIGLILAMFMCFASISVAAPTMERNIISEEILLVADAHDDAEGTAEEMSVMDEDDEDYYEDDECCDLWPSCIDFRSWFSCCD